MKKLVLIPYLLLGALVFGGGFSNKNVSEVKAEETPITDPTFWYSGSSYSASAIEGGLSFKGETTWADRISSIKKVDLNNYKVDLEFIYDFNTSRTNFDWFGITFAPGKTPFVDAGAAFSLIFRPQKSSTYVALMTSTYAEVVSDFITRTSEEDKYSIEFGLTDSSVTAIINGKTTLTTNSDAFNYRLLNRGTYNSYTANGGTNYQGNPCEIKLTNMSFAIHDSSKDVITYGATVTMNDPEIQKQISNNYVIVTKEVITEKEIEVGCNESIASTGALIGLLALAGVPFIFKKKEK